MKKQLLLVSLVLTSVLTFGQKPPQPFKAGDRIVFAGNSITDAGWYENYIWLYYITHYPNQKLEVLNGGIGGDVAKQIYTRLEGDLLAKKPNVLVITFGMNDSKYFEYGWHKDALDSLRKAAVDSSFQSYLLIEQKLKSTPNLTKIVMTSSPYDETVKNEKNYFPGKWETMNQIAAFQKKAAAKNDWRYVDLFHPMTIMEQAKQKGDSAFTLTGPDRIHPGMGGHLVMAFLFLQAQGLTGKPIAVVSVDAKRKKIEQADNCTITNLSLKKGTLSFTYLANSLPFPMDTANRTWGNPQKQSIALDVIPFTKEINDENLSVKNLPGKEYCIAIDGSDITTATARQLSDGINLTSFQNTPQNRQSKSVMELWLQHKELEDKMRAYFWINYDFLNARGMLFNDSQASLDSVVAASKKDFFVASKKDMYTEMRLQSTREKVQQQMDALCEQMYRLAKPAVHTVTIEEISSSQ